MPTLTPRPPYFIKCYLLMLRPPQRKLVPMTSMASNRLLLSTLVFTWIGEDFSSIDQSSRLNLNFAYCSAKDQVTKESIITDKEAQAALPPFRSKRYIITPKARQILLNGKASLTKGSNSSKVEQPAQYGMH
jgi:hypothetical protein